MDKNVTSETADALELAHRLSRTARYIHHVTNATVADSVSSILNEAALALRATAARCETLERELSALKEMNELEGKRLQSEIDAAKGQDAARWRMEGRAEFVSILCRQDPEDFAESVSQSVENGDAGDFSTVWSAEKVAALFDVPTSGTVVLSAIDRADSLYWSTRDEVDRLRERLAASEGAGWIKCDERLPDPGVMVLGWFPHSSAVVQTSRSSDKRGAHWWTHVGDYIPAACTYWQPLPPSPALTPAPIEPGAMP
jgi:hypothetical protein